MPVGDRQKTVTYVRNWLQPVHDNLADTNYFEEGACR